MIFKKVLIVAFFMFVLNQVFGQVLPEELEKKLRSIPTHVSQASKDFLIQSIQPAIGIKTNKVEESALPIGCSKIGGKPDLPPNFQWPLYINEPLAFCAQYNCLEISAFDKKGMLPSKGMLYVFICIDTSRSGFLNRKGSYRVIYTEENKNLIRTSFPDDYFAGGVFDPAKIIFFQYFTLPDDENYKVIDVRKKEADFNLLYYQLNEVIDKHTGQLADNYHQLLGEDRSVQCSVVWNFAEKELNIRTERDYQANKEKLNELINKYFLILQLDCNDQNSTLHKYGGSMVMYFGMEPEDLKEKRFDKVILAFQSA